MKKRLVTQMHAFFRRMLTPLVIAGILISCNEISDQSGMTLFHFPNTNPVASVSAPRFTVAMDDMEIIGPFASWANLKTDFGAVGDGVADDTTAFQTAFDSLGLATGGATTLYIPAGNYKITSSIIFKGAPVSSRFASNSPNIHVIGDSPSTTKITWAGPTGRAMLIAWGGIGTSFSRLTWDGKNTAGFGIAFWYNYGQNFTQGASSENQDEVFQDMSIGIMAGRLGSNFGQLDSEGVVRRVTFLRNTFAGLDTGSYNALDWWVFDSKFVDCARGVSNNFTFTDNATVTFAASGPNIDAGAGAMFVYRSLFQRSTVADIDLGNTQWFSFHNNVSVGSRRFLQSSGQGTNSSPTIIQNNRIIDTTDSASIANGNTGPLMLIDNQFRTKAGNAAPVVKVSDDWQSGRDVFSIGNRYTVASPIESVDVVNDRHVQMSDSMVSSASISDALPTLPSTPNWSNRTVFEVAAGANAATIQAAINSAVASASVNPIVHLPAGTYSIATELTIPAKKRIQLAGDGSSLLIWTGASGGNILKLNGPSYATIRDLGFGVGGTGATAIQVNQADQPGGRIFFEGSTLGSLDAADLVSTQLHMQANPYIYAEGSVGLKLSNVKNFVAQGSGPVGPVISTNGTTALISDSWYEGKDSALYRVDSGTFTCMGGALNPATHYPYITPVVPAIQMDHFHGKATFIGIEMNLVNEPGGVGVDVTHEESDSNLFFMGFATSSNLFFNRSASGGNVGLFLSKGVTAGVGLGNVPNVGTVSESFVTSMLSQARALQWDTTAYAAPANSTDLRFYHIGTLSSGAIKITGGL